MEKQIVFVVVRIWDEYNEIHRAYFKGSIEGKDVILTSMQLGGELSMLNKKGYSVLIQA